MMWRILSLLLVLISNGAMALSVPSSGIDWEKSNIAIEAFESPFIENQALFRCFGKQLENLPIEIPLKDIGFGSNSPGPTTLKQQLEAHECFQAAGTYQLNFTLFDLAGNHNSKSQILVLEPGAVEVKNTRIDVDNVQQYRTGESDFIRKLTSDCATENLVANGLDTCNLRVSFHDEFGNRVTKDYLKSIEMGFPGLDSRIKKIRIVSKTDNPFHQGVRFEDGKVTKVFSGKNAKLDHAYDFGIRSWAPTLNIGNGGSFPFLQVTSVKLPLRLQMDVVEVGSETIKTVDTEFELRFRPWVNLVIDPEWSLERHFYASLQSWSPLSIVPRFTSGVLQPDRVAISFRGVGKEGIEVLLKDKTTSPSESYQVSLDKGAEKPVGLQFLVKSLQSDLKAIFQLFGNVAYVFRDPIYGPKLIQYPMTIMTGETIDMPVLAEWRTLQVGADVEGKVLTDSRIINDPSTIFFSQSQADMREELVRNTYRLVRGIEPKDTEAINIDTDLNTGVYYVANRNVKLTSNEKVGDMIFGGGRRTIVIENGNLLIDRNLRYESDEDSLGIILISKEANSRTTGNVFINNEIKYFVGTYFLDGSLMSTLETDPMRLSVTESIPKRSETNNDNPNAPLGYQLVLDGTIISRNTWGGASSTPIRDPWDKEVDFETAARYDLDFIRRYQPTRDTDNEIVPDEYNDYCVKVEDQCDENPHAFIIRPDGRVKHNTPPGFSHVSSLSLTSE